MGLSIVISGGIIFVALMFTLMNIPQVFDSILSVEVASSEISALEESISQTEIRIDSLTALAGQSDVSFTLVNDGNEKLWNYDDFDVLITYDADIGGVKTRTTEELSKDASSAIGIPIGFDNVTPFDDASCGNPAICNFSHDVTLTGSNTILIVGVSPKGGDTVSSVTYNSLPLTEIRSDDDGGNAHSSLWYRVNPSTGINDVDVTLSSDTEVVIGAISFTGVDQVSPIDVDNGATGNSATPSVSLVTTIDNAWIIDTVGTSDGPMTEDPPQVFRWNPVTPFTPEGAGSTQVTTIPGSYTMSWTNGGGAKEWATSAAALAPAVSGSGPNPGSWSINSITPDIIDPGLINNNEQAEIVGNLSNPLFPGGIVIIKISSDNGVTSSISQVT